MYSKGTIVTIYEDPLTMQHKEGNAKIVGHVLEIEPGVDQYRVNFIGDDAETIVVRTIAEKPICSCPDFAGEDPNCRVCNAEVSYAAAD